MKNKYWREKLRSMDKHLKKKGERLNLVLIGGLVNVLKGDNERMTEDMDIWKEGSDVNETLKEVVDLANMGYNPRESVNGGYVQVVEEGIAVLGDFKEEELVSIKNSGDTGLVLKHPPIANLIISKLVRLSEKEAKDMKFLMDIYPKSKRSLEKEIYARTQTLDPIVKEQIIENWNYAKFMLGRGEVARIV